MENIDWVGGRRLTGRENEDRRVPPIIIRLRIYSAVSAAARRRLDDARPFIRNPPRTAATPDKSPAKSIDACSPPIGRPRSKFNVINERPRPR